MPCPLKPLEITFKFESMAADKKTKQEKPKRGNDQSAWQQYR